MLALFETPELVTKSTSPNTTSKSTPTPTTAPPRTWCRPSSPCRPFSKRPRTMWWLFSRHTRPTFFSLITSTTLIVLHIFSKLYFSLESDLSLIPGLFWPPHLHIYTVTTGWMLETNLFLLCFDLFVLLVACKRLQSLWNLSRLTFFLFFVNTISFVLVAILHFFIYALISDTELYFDTRVQGPTPFILGVVVALKQQIPDIIVIKKGSFKMRIQHLPITMLLLYNLASFFNVICHYQAHLANMGFVLSWIHLRFFENRGRGVRGDPSDEFAFNTFFPKFMRKWLAQFEHLVYLGLVKMGLRSSNGRNMIVHGAIAPLLASGVDGDGERRRQIALRALSQRLNTSPTDDVENNVWPDITDDLNNESNETVINVHNANLTENTSNTV